MGNCEKRNSASPHLRSNEGKVKVTKRNSVGNVSGVMSSLAKIRQNILESPYFHLTKDDALNKNYIVLSENKELGRTSIPQVSKYNLKVMI